MVAAAVPVRPLRRAPLQLVVLGLLAATIVAMVLGSAYSSTVQQQWSGPRWAFLVALWVASLVAVRHSARRVVVVLVPLLPLVGFMAFSTAWSVRPQTTFGRAGALTIVFMIAAALAVAMEEDILPRDGVVAALLGGMTVVALGGAVLLVVSQPEAMHPGTGRLNGLGGDSNTVSSMFGVGIPLALGAVLGWRGRRRRLAVAVLVVLVVSVVASGSRGSLLAAAAGSVVVVAIATRGAKARAVAVGLVALAAVAAAVGTAKPIGSESANHVPVPTGSVGEPVTGPKGHRVYLNAELSWRLEDDVGGSLPGAPPVDPHRSALNSSGRTQAWEGALRQVRDRPLAGYGFGTESLVFVDRYVAFQGSYAENAYIGLLLQIGALGLAVFLFAFVVAARRMRHQLAVGDEDERHWAAAFVGATAAGLVLALTQSFVGSAGNVAVLTFWIATLAATVRLGQRSASTSGAVPDGVSPYASRTR
jgi:hypothetical protein